MALPACADLFVRLERYETMVDQRNDNDGKGDFEAPFRLRDAFPNAQSIFTARHPTLSEIKDACFVALDANVLLLPFKLGDVDLPEVVNVYRPLAEAARLVVPAQAAREFAKHRSAKVAEMVKYLRDQASANWSMLDKRVGALSGYPGYEAAMKKAGEIGATIKKLRSSINDVADEIAADVGEDPVSIAYRSIFEHSVRADPPECTDAATFNAELKARYSARRPPGYKDRGKDDGGAGDLIIWKSIIHEGKERKQDCIFVTGDEKSDWYVQSRVRTH